NTSTCSFQVVIDAGTPVTLYLDSLTTDCQGVGNEITYNIHVKDFNDIVGLQFSVTWDPTVLQFNSVANEYPGLGLSPGNYNGYANVGSGLLQFLGGNAITGWPLIADGGIFFSIKFTVLNPNATTTLAFVGPFDAANSALDAVPVHTLNGYFKSEDLSAPTLVCPANIVQDAPIGTCQATVNIPFPQATDVCSGVQSVVKNPVSNVFTSGTTVVTFTATDNANNSSTCSFTVKINASSTPMISNCPADITVTAPGSDCTAIVNWPAPSAIDACGNVLTPVPNQGPNTPFNVGITPVFYVADDAHGHTDTCKFTVLVRDTVAPKITCPASFTLQLAQNQCCVLGGYQKPTATDNCDAAVDVVGDHSPTENYCVGVTTVNYIASDDFGNTATCSFAISVPDEIAPAVVTCPADIIVNSDPDVCGKNINWIEPAFDDLCDNNPLLISNSNNPGDFFDVGTYLVEYYASDISGNVAVCQFNVTVNDVIPPVLGACPNQIIMDLPINACTSVVSWTPPTASDNCTTVTLTGDHTPNSVFNSGTTVVTYTATDDAGNTASCTFNVILTDKIPPVLYNCPHDTVLTNVDPCHAVPTSWTVFPSATDNCSAVTIDSSSYRPGDAFPVGETIVVILATDASGNSDTCSFKIKVIGIPPGFNNVPNNIVLSGCPQTVTWSPPVPVGICNLDSLRSNYKPGDLFQNGITVVTYLAFQANGDTTKTSFTVTITDSEKPKIICPAGPVVVNVGGVILSDPSNFLTASDTVSTCDGAKLSFGLPAATDNCSTVSVTQTLGFNPGKRFPVGLDTLRFVATDASGNTSLCNLVIDVRPLDDLRPSSSPNPICKGTTNVVITLTDLQDATYYWTGPNNKDTLQVNNYNVVIGQENNVYSVFANVNGCKTKSDTIRLTLVEKPDAVNDTIYVQPGQADTFNILKNDLLTIGDPGKIKWQPQPINGLDSIGNGRFVYNPGANGQPVTFFYQLCSALCPDLCDAQMATVFVLFKDENCNFIPNVFTPNGDNNHDKFEIPCIGLIEGKNPLVVYNQWGDKVYEAASYDNSWDGTLNGKGKPLPDGVYYYIFKPSNGPAKKGFVEIIR
ncbi:MAG: HYR domain-containing protein, partial [Bacteroidota bacterium]